MAAEKYPKNIADQNSEDDDQVMMCFICSVKERWSDHKKRADHTSKLPYFIKVFVDNSYDHVKCESCNNQIPKTLFIQHARRHKLIPWNRPEDEFISYFKNFIKPMTTNYYCHLCLRNYDTWYSSLSHINCKRHKKNLENYIGNENINDNAWSSDVCENWVINDIFPFRFSQLQCWICNFIIDGYESVNDHIASENHKNNLTRKKIKVVTKRLMKLFAVDTEFFSTFINNYPSISLNSIQGSEHNLSISSANNISTVNSNSNNLINGFVLSLMFCLFSLVIAIRNEIFYSLQNLLLLYFIGACIYRCYCYLYNALSNKLTIMKSSQNIIEKSQVENELIISDLQAFSTLEYLVLYKLFRNFIFHNASKDYYCYFCHMNLPFKFLLSDAREHLKDPKHLNCVEKNKYIKNIAYESSCTPTNVTILVRNNIFQVDNSFLRCFTCFCLIPSYSCALEHLKDFQHEINWENLLNEIFKPWRESEVDETSVNKSNEKLIVKNEIIPLVETKNEYLQYFENSIFTNCTDYYCHKCKQRLPTKILVNKHINDVIHRNKLTFEQGEGLLRTRIPCEPDIFEIFVKNNVFSYNHESVKCYTCNVTFYKCNFKNVKQHINGRRHKKKHVVY